MTLRAIDHVEPFHRASGDDRPGHLVVERRQIVHALRNPFPPASRTVDGHDDRIPETDVRQGILRPTPLGHDALALLLELPLHQDHGGRLLAWRERVACGVDDDADLGLCRGREAHQYAGDAGDDRTKNPALHGTLQDRQGVVAHGRLSGRCAIRAGTGSRLKGRGWLPMTTGAR